MNHQKCHLVIDIACFLMLGLAAIVAIKGFVTAPRFVDRCTFCGEYFKDAESAHEHFKTCGCKGAK